MTSGQLICLNYRAFCHGYIVFCKGENLKKKKLVALLHVADKLIDGLTEGQMN